MIRRILRYPEPLLKKVATAVPQIDGALVGTIDDMVETMYAAPGVGLAAPQIGLSQRVIVLDVDHENKGTHLLKIVNPVIAEREGEIVWEEGCLSVRDYVAEVTRSARVLVRGYTPDQQEIAIEGTGLLAVALQHEIDHLDGKLFLDRISRLKRDLYRRRLKKMERDGREPPARRESLI
ncbi:MAG: peptide deformylase [Deltaproteobacteria bacterium]|nr:MAG: peptide deformylase [Deltaproteobacteria bacterium]